MNDTIHDPYVWTNSVLVNSNSTYLGFLPRLIHSFINITLDYSRRIPFYGTSWLLQIFDSDQINSRFLFVLLQRSSCWNDHVLTFPKNSLERLSICGRRPWQTLIGIFSFWSCSFPLFFLYKVQVTGVSLILYSSLPFFNFYLTFDYTHL